MLAKNIDQFMAGKGCALEKKFYSRLFDLSITFYQEDRLDGTITLHYEKEQPLHSFHGLYLLNDAGMRMSFVIEWPVRAQATTSYSAFTGILFRYPHQRECLLLKWLQINDTSPPMGLLNESGMELLGDKANADPFDPAR